MIEWLDDFYGDPDMRSTMLRNFLPLFTSYVTEATGGPVAAGFVQALAESYVDRHLGSSRAQLQEVVKGADDPLAALTARFDEWEEKRPEKVARNELVRSANAASVEKMREAGVTKMVWRASGGKTCPFCTELDGTIIEVTGTFFEAGDELNPEGATAPIHFESSLGHPPVHQGCVCSVEAVTEMEGAEADTELAPAVESTLDDVRGQIANESVEHGYVIDSQTGEVLYNNTDHNPTSVALRHYSKNTDNVMVHNHPSGATFSNGDLTVAASDNVSVMVVEGADARYTLMRPEGGWPNGMAMRLKYEDEIKARMGNGGYVDIPDLMNQSLQAMADEFGLDYRVRRF